MYWSKFFIPTIKEVPLGVEATSHKLLLRAGLVHMLTSGVYSYLPSGLRVLKNIENIIREEMNRAGALELFLPCLQPIELWKQTGRDKTLSEVMIRFEDKRGRAMCLGPTHEEVITDLVKNYVQSYRQLPVTLYQIQTKFRDETRPRFGIVRACEFIMKDAYSFDRDKQGLEKSYELMYEAYQNIFKRCGLDAVIVEADSGAMGGDISHEFMVSAPIGEDSIVVCISCNYKGGARILEKASPKCPNCKTGDLKSEVAIELGHIFQLGTKYSEAQSALFLDENGKQNPIIMGCYGIGVSRLIAAIIEKNNDAMGIIWPMEVAPFQVEILPLPITEPKILELSQKYYKKLQESGIEVLLDDRKESAGVKFNDADLIGIPYRIIVGKRSLSEDKVEIKNRRTGEVKIIEDKDVLLTILPMIDAHGKIQNFSRTKEVMSR